MNNIKFLNKNHETLFNNLVEQTQCYDKKEKIALYYLISLDPILSKHVDEIIDLNTCVPNISNDGANWLTSISEQTLKYAYHLCFCDDSNDRSNFIENTDRECFNEEQCSYIEDLKLLSPQKLFGENSIYGKYYLDAIKIRFPHLLDESKNEMKYIVCSWNKRDIKQIGGFFDLRTSMSYIEYIEPDYVLDGYLFIDSAEGIFIYGYEKSEKVHRWYHPFEQAYVYSASMDKILSVENLDILSVW